MNFGTVLTAMVTPFKENLEVNYEETERLTDHLINNGSDGIVVTGTTGEFSTLTDDENLALFKLVKNVVGKRGTVIAATGYNSTKESIHLSREAEKIGVDAIMLVAPYYNKPPQEGLYKHFKTIAQAVSLPIIVYNIPGRTASNITADTMLRLFEIENIVAVKEASGDLNQISQICAKKPENKIVYSGDDGLTLPILSVGGSGVISVASHIVGKKISEMIKLFLAGKVLEAAKIHYDLLPLFRAIFITTNPIPIKYALNLMGFKVGICRLPLCEPSESEKNTIKNVVEKYMQ